MIWANSRPRPFTSNWKTPAVLNTRRGGQFALDMAAIGGTLAAGGITWHDFIVVPLAEWLT
jgi:hypothetical protein